MLYPKTLKTSDFEGARLPNIEFIKVVLPLPVLPIKNYISP